MIEIQIKYTNSFEYEIHILFWNEAFILKYRKYNFTQFC